MLYKYATVSLVPRPIPSFSMLHTEKWNGPWYEVKYVPLKAKAKARNQTHMRGTCSGVIGLVFAVGG